MVDWKYRAMGQIVNKKVREFYKKGYKSDNKDYGIILSFSSEEKANVYLKKWKKRNINRDLSKQAQDKLDEIIDNWSDESTFYENGALLFKVGENDHTLRAGNCGKMACVAGYLAHVDWGVGLKNILMVTLSSPADHEFCMIDTRGTEWNNKQCPTVRQFAKSVVAPDFLIIDPWLNTVCAGDEYLRDGTAKLKKWGDDGKRVRFYGSEGEGWYPASCDEYLSAFAAGKIEITGFDEIS